MELFCVKRELITAGGKGMILRQMSSNRFMVELHTLIFSMVWVEMGFGLVSNFTSIGFHSSIVIVDLVPVSEPKFILQQSVFRSEHNTGIVYLTWEGFFYSLVSDET